MIWVKCSHRATVAKMEEKTEMVADFAIRAEKKKHKSVTSYDFMLIRLSHNKLLHAFNIFHQYSNFKRFSNLQWDPYSTCS